MSFSDCHLLDTPFSPGPCAWTHSVLLLEFSLFSKSTPHYIRVAISYSFIKIQLILPLIRSLSRQRQIHLLLITSRFLYTIAVFKISCKTIVFTIGLLNLLKQNPCVFILESQVPEFCLEQSKHP